MKSFLSLVLLILLLFSVQGYEMKNTINLSEMSIEEKIGQLMVIKPQGLNLAYLEELHVGGIFLNNKKTEENFTKSIEFYQNNSKIKLFVATDMEGYWNPFPFFNSKNFGEINSKEEAFNLGKEQGEVMKSLGFNLDFSPVVEIRNKVWKGRSFTGSDEEIKEKIKEYISGLQSQGIFATSKHYPGGNMIKNPHLLRYRVKTNSSELGMFATSYDAGVDFVMVGHPVIYGEIDSKGKPATVSPEVINYLKKDFEGLIITDAVTMMGLRLSYLFNFKKAYPDLILAGNDIILDTHIRSGYSVLKKRRDEIIKSVEKGKISEERIDESVKKILEKKGYNVLK